MRKFFKDNLKLIAWAIFAGLIGATVVADFDFPLFPNWNGPLIESGMTTNQILGAKAAVLAVLSGLSLLATILPAPTERQEHANNIAIILTSAISAAFAGLFWLLSETDENPGPFLIALIPFIVWTGAFTSVGLIFINTVDSPRANPNKRNVRLLLYLLALIPLLLVVVLLLNWIASRIL